MDWELQRLELFRQTGETDFIDMGIGGLDGTTLIISGAQINLGDRQYVKNALADLPGTMDLTLNRATNELNLLSAVPIKRGGKTVGFLNGCSDGNALSEIVDDTGFGENGYGYIMNGVGTVIAHQNRNLVLDQNNAIELVKEDKSMESLAKLTERMIDEKSGIGDYSYNGNELYAGYAPIEGTDWIFVIVADKNEVLAAIPTMRNSIFALVFVVLIISIVVTYIIGHLIAKPIIVATQYSATLADYDIAREQTSGVANNRNKYILIEQAMQAVSSQTTKLNLSRIQMEKMKDEILDALQNLSAIAEENSAATQEVTASMEEQAASIDEISAASEGLASFAQELQSVIMKFKI